MNKNDEMKILSAFEVLDTLKVAEEKNMVERGARDTIELDAIKYLKENATEANKQTILDEIHKIEILNLWNLNSLPVWYMLKTNKRFQNKRKTLNNMLYEKLKGSKHLLLPDSITGDEEMFEELKFMGYSKNECVNIFKSRLIFYSRFNKVLIEKASAKDLIEQVVQTAESHLQDTRFYLSTILNETKYKQTENLNNATSLVHSLDKTETTINELELYEKELYSLRKEIEGVLSNE